MFFAKGLRNGFYAQDLHEAFTQKIFTKLFTRKFLMCLRESGAGE